jgi:PadR family transcriptional regulator, regulatory protein PadR
MQCTRRMSSSIRNWLIQIKKGYLELCVLNVILSQKEIYGFQLIEILKKQDLDLKEGTLYPLLNRMEEEGILKSNWVTAVEKGNPKKYYSLSATGAKTLQQMNEEFERMNMILRDVQTHLKTP